MPTNKILHISILKSRKNTNRKSTNNVLFCENYEYKMYWSYMISHTNNQVKFTDENNDLLECCSKRFIGN
jgi:hypothetical protein